MIKKIVLIVSAIVIINMVSTNKASAQMYGVSTNILELCTGSINVGLDIKMGKQLSFEIPISINPISTDKLSFVNYTIRPTFKYWFYNVFVGHYLAISNTSSYFNVGTDGEYCKKGWLSGVGVSYGYNVILSKRMSMNFEAGAGGYYTSYERYKKDVDYTEDEYVYKYKKILFLPTRLTCGIIYYF